MNAQPRLVDRPAPPTHEAPRVERAVARPQRQASAPRAVAVASPSAMDVADRISEAARPWWFDVPRVAMACANVAMAPLNLAIRAAEAAVALALLGALAVGFGWHQGYISDKDVVAALKPVGQRILLMVQSAADGTPPR